MIVCDIVVVVAIWLWSVRGGILVKYYSEQGQGACIRKNTGAAAPLCGVAHHIHLGPGGA